MVSFINKKAADSQDVLDAESESKIKELLGQIDLYYYKDTDKADLTDGLYKGLFEGLGDSYSVYYTKEEYESMINQWYLLWNRSCFKSGCKNNAGQHPSCI